VDASPAGFMGHTFGGVIPLRGCTPGVVGPGFVKMLDMGERVVRLGDPKVAIIHDYLNQLGGAERVVGVLHEMFPSAPIYTLLVDPDKLWPTLRRARIIPSYLQKIGFVRRHFRLFFWLYPFVIRAFDLSHYDIVISSSSAYAKGVKVPKKGGGPLHVCYCHTPMRFAWNFGAYMENQGGGPAARFLAGLLVPLLRYWDVRTAKGVDVFMSNSSVVRDRIRNCYGRESTVVYPPVEVGPNQDFSDGGLSQSQTGSYFLVVSRLVSYKAVDLAVRACSAAGWELIVIGTGPDQARLMEGAGSCVKFLGWQTDEVVEEYMRGCLALIFPGCEDFGLTPLEANLRGRPVVAFAAGGALDTIVSGVNGIFFDLQTPECLSDALCRVSRMHWEPQEIRRVAMKFGRDRFEKQVLGVIDVNRRS